MRPPYPRGGNETTAPAFYMDTPEPSHNQLTFSVSELSGAVKRVMEDSFSHVRVRGEISKVTRHASGHIYVDMKDEKATLATVCWKGNAARLSPFLQMGLEVIATGRLSTFAAQSKYQMILEHLEPAGMGALLALLEQRKKQLEAEGLFDQARKKPLPYLPRVIGVVTSPTGAVIRDILHRVADRFPTHVLLWPVRVQGPGAALEIAEAIVGFNQLTPGGRVPRPDLLIVGRGGGSVEDLWCFNEEIVVRAAAASDIPLISAVGHETDTMLIDYTADRRAPTPTAAAEMALPVRAELQFMLQESGLRMARAAHQAVQTRAERLAGLSRGLPRPDDLMAYAQQRLDDYTQRLTNAPRQFLRHKEQELSRFQASLSPWRLTQALDQAQMSVRRMDSALQRTIHVRLERHGESMERVRLRLSATLLLQQIARRQEKITALSRILETLDYREVLKRGFALVKDHTGQAVTSLQALPDEPVSLHFYDGVASVQRVGSNSPAKKAASASTRSAKPKAGSGNQGVLF